MADEGIKVNSPNVKVEIFMHNCTFGPNFIDTDSNTVSRSAVQSQFNVSWHKRWYPHTKLSVVQISILWLQIQESRSVGQCHLVKVEICMHNYDLNFHPKPAKQVSRSMSLSPRVKHGICMHNYDSNFLPVAAKTRK